MWNMTKRVMPTIPTKDATLATVWSKLVLPEMVHRTPVDDSVQTKPKVSKIATRCPGGNSLMSACVLGSSVIMPYSTKPKIASCFWTSDSGCTAKGKRVPNYLFGMYLYPYQNSTHNCTARRFLNEYSSLLELLGVFWIKYCYEFLLPVSIMEPSRYF